MKRLLWLCFSLPMLATTHVNFFNIKAERGDNALVIRTEPEHLVAYELLKDERYSLDKNTYDNTLDSPFRQVAFLMRTLERNRGTVYADSSAPLQVISFTFELAVRQVTGDPIDMLEYKVVLGLDPEPGMGLISCELGGITHRFPINDLLDPDVYSSFLNHTVFPFGERAMKLPTESEYLVDLYYRWPEVEVSKGDFSLFDLFPSVILWNQGPIKKIKIHLGTTYSYQRENQWYQTQSEHLRMNQVSIDAYSRVLKRIEDQEPREVIASLEEYVNLVPGDKKALKRLMDYYLKEEMNTEAFSLITRFRPFFATIRGGLPNEEALARKALRKRSLLLGKKNSFERDSSIPLKITSPEDGDLVTGTTNLEFNLINQDSPVLEVECYLEEQLIAKLEEPPYRVPFTVDGAFGDLTLRVVAYFENETYQEHEIVVRTLKVDEEERVNLVALRASVLQVNSGIDRELTKDDFRISENKQEKKIEHFRKDTAPLRVAMVLDSSISMFGPKLYRAQYAVKTFLSKLGPEDRVSIFSFDNKVLKLSDFTNRYETVVPPLMTLSPQWATSLYDAMLIAHDALMGQNGTKVMIVVSDGDDSGSVTTDIHVASVLRGSPVMVYSVILPGGFLGEPIEGERFLNEMARLTGSISLRVRKVDNLDATFERLYQDLKSFYYMDYYSSFFDPQARETVVRLKGRGGKIRSRTIN